MAKLSARKSVVFDPVIKGSQAQISNSQNHSKDRKTKVTEQSAAGSSNSKRPPELARPGELERRFEEIKERFQTAELSYRDTIDEQVRKCFQIAHFLKSSAPGIRGVLSGEWTDYVVKNKGDRTKALKFVFKKVHSDPKKASFYYRATKAMFEEGIPLDQISSRVTSAGGYQQLADQCAKSLQGESGNSSSYDRNAAGNRPKKPAQRDSKQGIQRKHLPLEATSSEEDDAFLATVTIADASGWGTLPLPCVAHLRASVAKDAQGEWRVHVIDADPTE